MAPTNIQNKKPSNRRRKKRRTEDFSSSSESSGSSSSEASDNEEQEQQEQQEQQPTNDSNINIDDMDIDSDIELKDQKQINSNKIPSNLTIDEKKKLNKLSFTTTSISQLTNLNQLKNLNNLDEINNILDNEMKIKNNQFLKLMSNEFNEDLDLLRKKPDFNDKSLFTLAKLLQSGSNLFDIDLIRGIVEENERKEQV
ncbi:unnamed protein product [Candida verbasci]|uniref:Ribosome assembly protein 3 n=1 Tax=Candida verbasci TaxID=1227364 RepID=A0A9W4TWQ1_9ASCO|nr:unnamed protein product [Candida verbasci]